VRAYAPRDFLPYSNVVAKGRIVHFEFGETIQSNAFLDRDPNFLPAFERLAPLTNKCLVRNSQTRNRAEFVSTSGTLADRSSWKFYFLPQTGTGSRCQKYCEVSMSAPSRNARCSTLQSLGGWISLGFPCQLTSRFFQIYQKLKKL
jgi:hypothetical protein